MAAPLCPECGQPLRRFLKPGGGEGFVCWNCREKPAGAKPSSPVEESRLDDARALLKVDRMKREGARNAKMEWGELPLWKQILVFLGLPMEVGSSALKNPPRGTSLLILACLVASILTSSDPDRWTALLGYHAHGFFLMRFVTSLTSFFLHAGLGHLIGNMYFLWAFGPRVENDLGLGKYLALLVAGCWMGSLLISVFHSADILAIGASSGISAIMGYYLVRFPNRRFIVYLAVFPLTLPAAFLVGLFVFSELFSSCTELAGMSDGIAHLGHLGGLFAGWLFARRLAPKVP